MFTDGQVTILTLKKQVLAPGFQTSVINQRTDQIHFSLNNVKLTFISTKEICDKAKGLSTGVFNPVLCYKQLCYFDDISFEEQVEYIPGFEVSEEEVKAFLTDAALTGF